jgi:hypothetical protein
MSGDSGNSPEPSKEDLAKRVDKLEAAIKKMQPTRRDLLTGAAAAGVGALGVRASSDSAQAGVGTLGESNNRLDLVSDVIDANDLQGAYPTKIRVVGDAGVATTIDPSTTTTPIGDAISAAPNRSTIQLPPGTTQEDSTLVFDKNVSLETWAPYGIATIDMSNVTGKLVSFDGYANQRWDSVRIIGPGDDATATDALVFETNQCDKLHFENLSIREIYGSAIRTEDAGHYQITFENLYVSNVDAGDVKSAIYFNSNAGPSWNFEHVWVYPSATTSGTNSQIFWNDTGVFLNVGEMNIGGSTGPIISQLTGGRASFHGVINYEPDSQQSTPSGIFVLTDDDPVVVDGPVIINGISGASADDVFRVRAGGHELGIIKEINSPTVTNYVDVELDISEPVVYPGVSGDVNNSSGSSLSSQVSCLGDLSSVS